MLLTIKPVREVRYHFWEYRPVVLIFQNSYLAFCTYKYYLVFNVFIKRADIRFRKI